MNNIIESEIEGILDDTTVSKNEWIRRIQAHDSEKPQVIVPLAGIYLQDYIDSWMTAPVGVYKGKPIVAETRRVYSLEEFKRLLENSTDKFIMYMPIYIPPQPRFEHIGDGRYEYTGESESTWHIRGCFV